MRTGLARSPRCGSTSQSRSGPAATALARERIVVTADQSGFSELPGVAVRVRGAPR
jgi:hypothetical protein